MEFPILTVAPATECTKDSASLKRLFLASSSLSPHSAVQCDRHPQADKSATGCLNWDTLAIHIGVPSRIMEVRTGSSLGWLRVGLIAAEV